MNNMARVFGFIGLLICIAMIMYVIWFINQPTYKINVYEADTRDLVQIIEDDALIKDLIKQLREAKTISTAMTDMILPEYRIEIVKNEEIIYAIGYYTDNTRNSEQYYHYEGDFLYELSFELPIHHVRNE